MESAIKTVVCTYLKSAKGKESLSGKDFQSMIKNQLGNILSNADSSKAVKDLQQGLDDNADGKVSFQEYMKLIGYLANSLSEQHLLDKREKANGDGEAAVTQSEAPAADKTEPATAEEEPAADGDAAAAAADAPPAANGEAEAEKKDEAPAEEKTAEEEKTEEETS